MRLLIAVFDLDPDDFARRVLRPNAHFSHVFEPQCDRPDWGSAHVATRPFEHACRQSLTSSEG